MTRQDPTPRRKSPANVFRETDFYTMPLADGGRGLGLELGLGTLETDFVRIRDHLVRNRKEFSTRDKASLCAFMAAAMHRTKAHKEHWQRQWGRVLRIADDMQAALDAMTPEERRRHRPITPVKRSGDSMSIAEVRELAARPLQHGLVTMIKSSVEVLMKMSLAIICTADDVGFITSDRPCTIFDARLDEAPFPYNSPRLTSKTAEVTMPITPYHLVFACWADANEYIDVPQHVVDDLNRRIQRQSHAAFIVRRNTMRREWFEGPDVPCVSVPDPE